MGEYNLKPCPFCGGKATLRKMNKISGYHVKCTKCFASGGKAIIKEWHNGNLDIAQGQAIALWNKRKT